MVLFRKFVVKHNKFRLKNFGLFKKGGKFMTNLKK